MKAADIPNYLAAYSYCTRFQECHPERVPTRAQRDEARVEGPAFQNLRTLGLKPEGADQKKALA